MASADGEPTSNAQAAGPAAGADFGLRENPVRPPSIQPLLASSIFHDALGGPSEPGGSGSSREAEQRLQEEEFQRRLRGEYERSQERLGEIVSENMLRSLRLTSIRLSPPPPTTRPAFLSSVLSPFLTQSSTPFARLLYPTPPSPNNLHEILLTTRAMYAYLDKFGIYDMSRASARFEPRRGGDEDEVELVLGLRERGRHFLKAGTDVGSGEGGGYLNGRLRNVLGGGETIEGQASVGTKTKSAYEVAFTTPVMGSPFLQLALQGFAVDKDNSAFASHREWTQGGRARLSAVLPWGTHDLSLEHVKREIGDLSTDASVSIRELARPSDKSSLIHTWTSDTREDPIDGTTGRLLRATYEYAGLPGSSSSVNFFKSTTQSQVTRALYPGSDIRLSLSSLTTLLFPLRRTPTELPDRVHLGGPNSVRGWRASGMGLRDGQDSLGGDLAWGLGLSIFSRIPKKEQWPLRLHSFLNVGKMVGYDRERSFPDNVAIMYRNPNVSVGLGLIYRYDPVRVELNFTMPLVGRKGERTARGFGVGLGLEFL